MTPNDAGIGNPYERELQYYRRECNDLGARLLRLQEEQSQAFREARRSRTVVKLVREAYRFGDPAQTAHDVGGPVLEVIVDNLLCDGAALLREEPLGGGRFLVAHAIGRTGAASKDAIKVRRPPAFYHSAGLAYDPAPDGLLDVLGLPYVLWAYDSSSGYALVVGNRSEGNVSRPFEAGDRELIESALSVYLDVLYRKQAEAQLRHAKQSAEEAGRASARLLETFSEEVRLPLQAIAESSAAMAAEGAPAGGVAWFQDGARRITEATARLAVLTQDTLRLAMSGQPTPALDVEWVALDEVVRAALRFIPAANVRNGLEPGAMSPQRRIVVCVDRERMERAIRTLVNSAVARAAAHSLVRITARRRSDGSLECLVSAPSDAAVPSPGSPSVRPEGEPVSDADTRLDGARQVIAAHGGMLVTEARPGGGTRTRLILPAQSIREDDLTAE